MPLYQKLSLPSVMTWKTVTMNVCGYGLDLFASQDPQVVRSARLSQVVTTPIRGSAILDLVITNIHSFYDISTTIAPLGTSNHKIV